MLAHRFLRKPKNTGSTPALGTLAYLEPSSQYFYWCKITFFPLKPLESQSWELFFYQAQWKTVLGWTWQQETKLAGKTSLQVKLFFLQMGARWCFLQWLRFLHFLQCSSLSLVDSFELYYAPFSHKSLNAHFHHISMASTEAVQSLCQQPRNEITHLPSWAWSNWLVTSQAEQEAFVTGSWQHQKACE